MIVGAQGVMVSHDHATGLQPVQQRETLSLKTNKEQVHELLERFPVPTSNSECHPPRNRVHCWDLEAASGDAARNVQANPPSPRV